MPMHTTPRAHTHARAHTLLTHARRPPSDGYHHRQQQSPSGPSASVRVPAQSPPRLHHRAQRWQRGARWVMAWAGGRRVAMRHATQAVHQYRAHQAPQTARWMHRGSGRRSHGTLALAAPQQAARQHTVRLRQAQVAAWRPLRCARRGVGWVRVGCQWR